MLYQINTRVWLRELSAELGREATLDDIGDNYLDEFVKTGFEWIWFLSVWQTGSEAQHFSRTNPDLLKEYNQTLGEFTDDDVPGSGFAITSYSVHKNLGGNEALQRLRERMQKRGLKLMLDFVPNHTAPDHHWVQLNPDYFIKGNENLLASEPKNYTRVQTASGEIIFARGRDPFFPGWGDTLQLNYNNEELQQAIMNELIKISTQCDGLRCDMAMLVIPDVFEKTWGLKCNPFWPDAIKKTKEHTPGFVFTAEVYWDLEWALQQMGFDYTYDKRLYDRLKEGNAGAVNDYLKADLDYQNKMVRFLENHDEPRAAGEFPDSKHEAAATITYFSPGLRFFHQGQFQGKKKRISAHLGRGPVESINVSLQKFYTELLKILYHPIYKNGEWKLIEALPAWTENYSYNNYICFTWELREENKRSLIVVNYSADRSQCYLKLPFADIKEETLVFRDQFSDTVYQRPLNELQSTGLYLDEPGWKYYAFAIEND
jgi:hypothetical protein